MNERNDELASAWLDGELDDAELRAVARDDAHRDALRQARQELAAAQAALAEPVTAPEGLADIQIAAAVELLAPRVEPDGQVVALPVRPTRGRSRLLARAAAAVLVVAGLGLGVAAVVDDPAAQDDAALTASSAGEVQRSADTAGGAEQSAAGGSAEADEGAAEAGPSAEAAAEAAPGLLSRTASELAEAAPFDATGLLAALERIHGPAGTWPDEPVPSDSCTTTLTPADGRDPVAAVAFERSGVSLELIVPADGEAYVLERGSCDPVG